MMLFYLYDDERDAKDLIRDLDARAFEQQLCTAGYAGKVTFICNLSINKGGSLSLAPSLYIFFSQSH